METDAKQLDKKYKYVNKCADIPVDYSDIDDKDICCIDYEQEYYRQNKLICSLTEENERLKQALVNVSLSLGNMSKLP